MESLPSFRSRGLAPTWGKYKNAETAIIRVVIMLRASKKNCKLPTHDELKAGLPILMELGLGLQKVPR